MRARVHWKATRTVVKSGCALHVGCRVVRRQERTRARRAAERAPLGRQELRVP
jgi:hypothetical protein